MMRKFKQEKKKEKANLIFYPEFSSLHKANILSGRGVGLSMVKRVIEDLGGNIELTSKKDHGTSFTLSVPREKFDLM